MSATRNNSVSSTTSMASVKSWAKAHHHAVNDAYAALYGSPRSFSIAESETTVNSASSPKKTSRRDSIKQAWAEFKSAAREHHIAVNEAYADLYGNSVYNKMVERELKTKGSA